MTNNGKDRKRTAVLGFLKKCQDVSFSKVPVEIVEILKKNVATVLTFFKKLQYFPSRNFLPSRNTKMLQPIYFAVLSVNSCLREVKNKRNFSFSSLAVYCDSVPLRDQISG